jgi:hypothetical protein
MRGRCFEVSGNFWKTRSQIPSELDFTVELLGLNGTRKEMEANGWSFLQETNNFTSKQRILAMNKYGVFSSGTLYDGHLFLLGVCNTKYGQKLNAQYVKIEKEEAINLDDLDIVDLLNAIERRQKLEMPTKPKPQAEVISISHMRA